MLKHTLDILRFVQFLRSKIYTDTHTYTGRRFVRDKNNNNNNEGAEDGDDDVYYYNDCSDDSDGISHTFNNVNVECVLNIVICSVFLFQFRLFRSLARLRSLSVSLSLLLVRPLARSLFHSCIFHELTFSFVRFYNVIAHL